MSIFTHIPIVYTHTRTHIHTGPILNILCI